jgi:hypothetical protein
LRGDLTLIATDSPQSGQFSRATTEHMRPVLFRISAALFIGTLCLGAESKVVLDDETVSVADVTTAGEYKVEGARLHGSLWVALDNAALLLNGAGATVRTVHAGEAELVAPGTEVFFRSLDNRPFRLIVIAVKRKLQDLTVQASELKAGGELQDASDRNQTLLIALSSLRVRDVQNLASESEWKPGPPRVVQMLPAKCCGFALALTISRTY